MNRERFEAITANYPRMRIAVAGDFCLDRYLEIDPSRSEVSIETGLEVFNVTRVRAQPGGAGTILNNLSALGIGTLMPVGFCGEDGEGHELQSALSRTRSVRMDFFIPTAERCTFTYCKPLVLAPGEPPRELNRLDFKNWTRTPPALTNRMATLMRGAAQQSDAMILLRQVDIPDTGLLTKDFLREIGRLLNATSGMVVVADSRSGFSGFPPVICKMNAAELCHVTTCGDPGSLQELGTAAANLARQNDRPVLVTLAERGIIGAAPDGSIEHVPALPVRGPIDIVGAGDAVSANITAALASGATLREALELATAAASVVIHQLGTTGTASVPQLAEVLFGVCSWSR